MKVLLQIVTDWPNLISAAIRFTTRSWASHVEFVLADGSTFGARCTGVKSRPYQPNRYMHIERYSAPGITEAYDWALTQAGKSYDFSAITGIALNRNWRDESRYFCSELVALAFEKADAPLLNPDTDAWRITPRDILLSLQIWRAEFKV